MWKRLIWPGLALSLGLLAACGPTPVPPPARPATLHLEVPGDADAIDIPWLMAIDALREQGYTVETTAFADTSVPSVAMEQGDLDFASLSNLATWAAIEQGAKIDTLMPKSANSFLLLVSREVTGCADLDGRAVAASSWSAVPAAMLMAYVAEHCPEASPQQLTMRGGSSRLAALLAGEIDGAILDVDDLAGLGNDQADYRPLVIFSEEFPGLVTTSYFVRHGLAEQYPETTKDIIRALLTARRQVQDPAVLQAEFVKRLEMESPEAQALAELYLAQHTWNVNGGYTLETVQENLDFLIGLGELPAGMQAADVADLTLVDEVLAEIGQQ